MSQASASEPERPNLIVRGTPIYRRTVTAVFGIGTAVMTMLYAVQPIMKFLGVEFDVSASQTAFLMSATTIGVAAFVLVWGGLANRIGERLIIVYGLAVAVLTSVLIPFAVNWTMIIALRAIQGIALAGPASASLAWIANHVHPTAVARVSGYYIAATTVGGMTGRLLTGFVTEHANWRIAIFVVASCSAFLGFIAHVLLPRDVSRKRHAVQGPRRDSPWHKHQRHCACAMVFFAMIVFVGMFNVLSYRLAEAPWQLGPAVISLFFLTYLAGTFTSSRVGSIDARFGARKTILGGSIIMSFGVIITYPDNLVSYTLGLLLMCAGFFTMHSLASSRAAYFHPSRGRGSGTYLMNYYLGSSAGAIAFGYAWEWNNWNGAMVIALIGLVLTISFALAVSDKPVD